MIRCSEECCKTFLFITYALGGGGAERALSMFANALVRRGHRVTVYSYEHFDSEYYLESGVEVVYSEKSRLKDGVGKVHKYLIDAFTVRKIYLQGDYDYVIPFCTEMVMCSFVGLIGTNAVLIATERNNPVEGVANRLKRHLRDVIYSRCAAVWTQSEAQAQYYRFFCKKPVFVIQNIVEMVPIQLPLTGEIKRFISVGRLAPQKNQKLLIEAFSLALRKVPYITLDIYGSGPLEGELLKLIDDLGVSGNVMLAGTTDDVRRELACHDAFLFSSDYEGLPNALIEAMLAGLPVVTTRFEIGAEDFIEDRVTGILVQRGSVEDLAGAIIELVCQPEKARAMGVAASERLASRFGEEELVGRLLEECAEVSHD